MHATTIIFLNLLILGSVSCGGNSSTSVQNEPIKTTTPSSKPNILLIIADDIGLDASAQYNLSDDLPVTPTLDTLAANGIVFDNAWATPSCTTTRGSLITGMHGVNSGVDTVPNLMDTDLLTLQRYLSTQAATADYQSAVIGKWHLAGTGANLDHPNESGVNYYSGNISGVLPDYNNWPLVTNGFSSTSTEYHTTAVTNNAISWIDEQTKPWFMWLAYSAPHSPFHLPPENLHTRDLSGTADDIDNNPRDYFLAAIEAMDTEIGRLLASLTEEEQANTLIVFIGDNGTPGPVVDASAFERRKAKGSLYEGGIRIPMTVSGAGVSRRGERESALVNTVDFYPTVLEATGANPNTAIDGISFLSLLDNDSTTDITRDYNYSEFVSAGIGRWTVRSETHKLIESSNGERELYLVDEDLREDNNLISTSTSGYEEIITDLAIYADSIRNNNTPPAPGESQDITDIILTSTNTSCVDYANNYTSNVIDINNSANLQGNLTVRLDGGECVFNTNAIPNHDFNDGANNFANPVSEQMDEYRVSATPTFAANTSRLLLTQDNALMLNGVKVDLLAAACFGVGDERVGCNDIDQAWRFDPMFTANSFRVDSHNAHTQPNGGYHYHGHPNALFDDSSINTVVGFAADGFPIFSSFIDNGGNVRKVLPRYRLKTGTRPSGNGEPGGNYDGTFRDDYIYDETVAGDLDECNGMTANGVYGYYVTDAFPYMLSCFKGTPNDSFFKN